MAGQPAERGPKGDDTGTLPWPMQPGDRIRLREAAEAGRPFVALRDDHERLQLRSLDPTRPLVFGRSEETDVRLTWDPVVSRVHAVLALVGGSWTIEDDGLSLNGTRVNGERVRGVRRLRDGDVVGLGTTLVLFRDPGDESVLTTLAENAPQVEVSPAQRRVLLALVRPLVGERPRAPASNQQIATELFIGVQTVKSHLRALFALFGVDDIPQNQKRAALADVVLRRGVVRVEEVL